VIVSLSCGHRQSMTGRHVQIGACVRCETCAESRYFRWRSWRRIVSIGGWLHRGDD
jgi:hypothetical protein